VAPKEAAVSVPAVEREAEWLRISGDGLPSLLTADGGPFDVVQAYRNRTPPQRKTALYLIRPSFVDVRFTNQRKIRTHTFTAHLWWPIGSSTTSEQLWEKEQRALDLAVDLVITRLDGFLADKTHGGRFLSVAEAPEPGRITVSFADPLSTATGSPAVLIGQIAWMADDSDYTA
jgi:hypothetical protein